MTYAFLYKELTCLKKMFKLDKLHGVGKTIMPCWFTKGRLLKTDIIEKNNNQYVFTSLYQDLFNEWTNMKYVITFYGQGREKVDKHILMINSRKLITYEEDIYDVLVGYYLYDTIGIRNYILDHLDVNFEMKVPDDMRFRIVIDKDKYEALMKMDETVIDELSQKCNIHKSVLKKYAGKISTKDILKTVICHDVENDIKMCVDVITDKNANYLLKRVVKNDNTQYVLSICDSSVLPQELQNMQ